MARSRKRWRQVEKRWRQVEKRWRQVEKRLGQVEKDSDTETNSDLPNLSRRLSTAILLGAQTRIFSPDFTHCWIISTTVVVLPVP